MSAAAVSSDSAGGGGTESSRTADESCELFTCSAESGPLSGCEEHNASRAFGAAAAPAAVAVPAASSAAGVAAAPALPRAANRTYQNFLETGLGFEIRDFKEYV